MAGMFYSLQETAERLGKTEDEVKQLAAEGKLREFRDGSSLLFKIEEVNALMAEDLDQGVESGIELDLEPDVAETDVTAESDDEMDLELDLESDLEPADEEASELELEPVAEEEPPAEPEEEQTSGLELLAEAEATSELDLSPDMELDLEDDGQGETSDELSESDILAGIGDDDLSLETPEETADEISLAPETAIGDGDSDITAMDTALTGEGISILGETDADYDITEDSLAETVGPAGTSTEASLEEIEGDVNLDSFGSGSGLLDLSLQADDTSLGGILDEIYTTEGDDDQAGEGGDMLDDMTAEADHVAEEEMVVAEPMMAVPTVTPTFAEAAPDSQSNILGMLLFLPLLVLLYACIVTISAQREFMPSILSSIQGLVWYIMGGAAFVSILVVAASFMIGGEKAPKTARPKKEKKARAKKEKKPKKEKKAKADKPKKEKKSLFGKKK